MAHGSERIVPLIVGEQEDDVGPVRSLPYCVRVRSNWLGGFQEEWVKACKGDLKTSCDFDYNGRMTETMCLGLVAYRVGKKIQYDGKTGRVTDNAEANALLSKKYREGWTLNG